MANPLPLIGSSTSVMNHPSPPTHVAVLLRQGLGVVEMVALADKHDQLVLGLALLLASHLLMVVVAGGWGRCCWRRLLRRRAGRLVVVLAVPVPMVVGMIVGMIVVVAAQSGLGAQQRILGQQPLLLLHVLHGQIANCPQQRHDRHQSPPRRHAAHHVGGHRHDRSTVSRGRGRRGRGAGRSVEDIAKSQRSR